MKRSNRTLLGILCVCVVLSAGCSHRPEPAPPVPEPPPTPVEGVSASGYSIQLGAFAQLGNAVKLTRFLQERGEEAFYFRSESGLYKVRVGDYASRPEAREKAEQIVAQGYADSYYIVRPEDLALARSRIYGASVLREEIVRTAESFMGVPYQWGGSSPEDGFDCSGLAMAAYRMNGLNLPRSSREQFNRGVPVNRGQLRRGDLVFFSISSGRKVSHVGVYAGGDSFIHAPGEGKKIRVDRLSNSYFRRHYAGARTYF